MHGIRRQCPFKANGNFHPSSSLHRERLNLAVLSLKEGGELAKLKAKWWQHTQQCPDEAQVRRPTAYLADSGMWIAFNENSVNNTIIDTISILKSHLKESCFPSERGLRQQSNAEQPPWSVLRAGGGAGAGAAGGASRVLLQGQAGLAQN